MGKQNQALKAFYMWLFGQELYKIHGIACPCIVLLHFGESEFFLVVFWNFCGFYYEDHCGWVSLFITVVFVIFVTSLERNDHCSNIVCDLLYIFIYALY